MHHAVAYHLVLPVRNAQYISDARSTELGRATKGYAPWAEAFLCIQYYSLYIGSPALN